MHQQTINTTEKKDNKNKWNWKCDWKQCNAIFRHKYLLSKHKKNHLKPYKCLFKTCNKSFSSKSYLLQIHNKIHENKRKAKCKFCNMKFTDPSTLRSHLKYVHSTNMLKRFICKICQKQFTKKCSLKAHFQTHQKRKNRQLFYCIHCNNKTFTVKSNLNRHLKIFHSPYELFPQH
eukprot:286078_1